MTTTIDPGPTATASAETRPVPCAVLRGGTSRAVFFLAADLPADRETIEQILLSTFGSPDARQINGLGGASSQTSKAAIIGPSSRPDADVDYTFGQVSITTPVVDWGGNCGNISSAVGPFAIDSGLVPVTGDRTVVRIHNTNTGKIIRADVPVIAGRAAIDGDCAIPGVPGTGARILMDFRDPGGSQGKGLLPTSRPRDVAQLADGRRFTVSVVDAANPVAFLRASELGMTGQELPLEIEADRAVTEVLEEVRGIVAAWLGIVSDPADATRLSPGLPKVGFVASPADYTTTTGDLVRTDEMDLLGRLMSMQTAHRSYMVTGAICTSAAALIEGTVVHEVCRSPGPAPSGGRELRIGHPYGVMRTEVDVDDSQEATQILGVTVERTARHILDGQVYVPARLFAGAGAATAIR